MKLPKLPRLARVSVRSKTRTKRGEPVCAVRKAAGVLLATASFLDLSGSATSNVKLSNAEGWREPCLA